MQVVSPVMVVLDESCSIWCSWLHNNNVPSLRWRIFLGEPSTLFGSGDVLTMEMLSIPQRSNPFDLQWAPEGIALICFTSGTTGKPKGVVINHRALIVQSLAKIAVVGYGEDDVYLHTAPLCHIGGISSCMAMLMVGACHVFIPKFEAGSALEAIEQHHVSSLISVPAIMADLISMIRRNGGWKGGEHVKKILNGGGGLSFELVRDAAKIFPSAKILSAYGMTEACSSLTFMTLHDPKEEFSGEPIQKEPEMTRSMVHRLGGVCVGKPAPHVELQVQGDGSSPIGRIFTRGPHVMLGYWDQNLATVSDSGERGWLDTGDIGWVDGHGHLWLVGRANGRIKSGGENVCPEEVEVILNQHPGVSSAVVVGLPDSRLTEVVAACIQMKENWQWDDFNLKHRPESKLWLSSKILQMYCKQKNLTGFKIPKIFMLWRKPFPLTTTGKLRRDEVRREVMSNSKFLPSSL
ncbi:PREDICTED: 2-succinylbenzoate--CoA ligase, chloroplastic/peroxisomal isoform X2 [Nelumbo nucifera]|nr:PREDICTED: 2-succinylbenzoate--CoA ligase, chloroplastic/peroxisomal isoform X2 [Nelumbo nucifera]